MLLYMFFWLASHEAKLGSVFGCLSGTVGTGGMIDRHVFAYVIPFSVCP